MLSARPAWTLTNSGRTVAITPLDQRFHRRVECFLVPVQREQVPVWIFKPADALEASAGLVMNLSDGGLQVLTAADDALEHPAYEIQLLLGEDEAVPRFRGRVTRVWTREASSAGWLSGLRFADPGSPAEDFIRVYRADAAGRRWVRCLLVPLAGRVAHAADDADIDIDAEPQPQDTNTI